MLDKRWFAPSALPVEQQKQIIDNFRSLHLPERHMPSYEILFSKNSSGPNAFALPGGTIVLPDERIKLLADDDAINAVLAHELAHVHERHLAQRVIQDSLLGAASTALFGDVSSSLAAIPIVLVDLQYSRVEEQEADDFAVRVLQENGMSASKLALVFQKLLGTVIQIGLPTCPPILLPRNA